GLFERKLTEPRHAHQLRHAVDFSRTRAALARFAVPSQREVVSLIRLDSANGVKHNHARRCFDCVVDELAFSGASAPNTECGLWHQPISSMTCFNSVGISGIASRTTFIVPSDSFLTAMLIFANASLFAG